MTVNYAEIGRVGNLETGIQQVLLLNFVVKHQQFKTSKEK